MKIFNGIKRVVKPFVDAPAWVGYAQLKDNARKISNNFRELFVPRKAERIETFAEAMARLNLTETDLQRRYQEFTRLIIIFSLMSFVLLGYTFYLIWSGSLWGSIASFGLTILIFTYSFRFHLWRYQIRQRRLGCTIQEWLNSSFIGGKK